MRAMVVEEYGTASALSEVAGPPGPAADVLAASLNPVDLAVSAGLNPFRRPEPPLVLGMDRVARRADGALVHFFQPAPRYGAFAKQLPLADAETVPLPGGLDPSRAAALGISGVAAIWDDFAAGRPQTKIIVKPNGANPLMTAPARARVQETTGLSPEFPARESSPEASPPTSGNHQNLPARTGDGPVLADALEPLVPYTERGACEPIHRKEAIMTTTVSLSFAALTIDSADPAALADFWGKALGRPVSPGAVAGDTAVDATGPEAGPRMILHHPPEPGTAKNSVHPVLVTDHHDEEIERLTGLGARPLNQIKLPPAALPPGVAAVRQTTFADPEGNEFDLVTWQPE